MARLDGTNSPIPRPRAFPVSRRAKEILAFRFDEQWAKMVNQQIDFSCGAGSNTVAWQSVWLKHEWATCSRRLEPCWGMLCDSIQESGLGLPAAIIIPLHYYSLTTKKQSVDWWRWVCSPSSPWRLMSSRVRLYPNNTKPSHLIVYDCNVPARLLINFLIAIRTPWMHKDRFSTIKKLMMRHNASFLHAAIFAGYFRLHELGLLLAPARLDYFITTRFSIPTVTDLRRFAEGRPLLSLKTIGYSRGIPNNSMWYSRKPQEQLVLCTPRSFQFPTADPSDTARNSLGGVSWGVNKKKADLFASLSTIPLWLKRISQLCAGHPGIRFNRDGIEVL